MIKIKIIDQFFFFPFLSFAKGTGARQKCNITYYYTLHKNSSRSTQLTMPIILKITFVFLLLLPVVKPAAILNYQEALINIWNRSGATITTSFPLRWERIVLRLYPLPFHNRFRGAVDFAVTVFTETTLSCRSGFPDKLDY